MPRESYKPFRDIWLLNTEGRVIFEHRGKTNIDTVFIKMLLDSLSEFVNDYFHEEVTNFRLGNQIYTFLKTNDFYFIGSSKIRKNTKKIKKKLLKVLSALRENVS